MLYKNAEVINVRLSKDTRRIIEILNTTKPDLPNNFYDVNTVSAHPSIDDIPGDAVWGILKTLERQGFVVFDTRHGTAVKRLEPCRSYAEIDKLEAADKWKERIWGFICGIVSTVILNNLDTIRRAIEHLISLLQ